MIFPLLAYAIGSTRRMEKTVMDALIAAENEGTVHPPLPIPDTQPCCLLVETEERLNPPSILAGEDTLMVGVVMVLVVGEGGGSVPVIKKKKSKKLI